MRRRAGGGASALQTSGNKGTSSPTPPITTCSSDTAFSSSTSSPQVLCGGTHKQGQLCAIQRPAPAQTDERCFHQPEVRIPRALWRHEFPERAHVEGHGLEEPHPPVIHARQHPVPLAAEQRHAEASTFIECEPVAVGAPHGKKTTHCRTPYPRP